MMEKIAITIIICLSVLLIFTGKVFIECEKIETKKLEITSREESAKQINDLIERLAISINKDNVELIKAMQDKKEKK